MKTGKQITFIALSILVFLVACTKDEPLVIMEDLEIIYSYVDESTVHFKHNNAVEGTPSWDFGNGETSDQDSATVVYPLAGLYQVKLTITTSTVEVVARAEVSIVESDPDLIGLTDDEKLLSGGIDATNGKTWVWANFVPQHMMKAQFDPWQWWWGAASNEKADFNIYDDEMIFSAVNFGFVLENNDSTYVNVDYLADFSLEGDEDMTAYFDLSEATYTWELVERSDGIFLKLGGGFMSYYLSVSEYKVEVLTEYEMTLSTVIENVYWQFRFKSEGFEHPDAVNPEVNENLSDAKNVDELVDDFEEDADVFWLFQAESGGGVGNDETANPSSGGIDTSAIVYSYKKGTWEYTNASMELDFTLDLTTHSKVSMKVFFPSSNVYSTMDTGLKKKASVKLQRWNESSPWENQAEVIIEDIVTDEWTELIFDFNSISIPANRMTGYFNKIVIQFGDEGHNEDGTFYFDDFEVLAN